MPAPTVPPRTASVLAFALASLVACACSKRNASGDGATETVELGEKAAACTLEREQRLAPEASTLAGLTGRRLQDGRLLIGVVAGGEPKVVVVDAKAAVSLRAVPAQGAGPGEVLRVTPTLEHAELVTLVDVRRAGPAGVQARCCGLELEDCRSFADTDGKRWVLGVRRSEGKLTLVARRPGEAVEHEIFALPGSTGMFADLQSESLGDRGYAVSARSTDQLVLARLEPDLTVEEVRAYAGHFLAGAQLLGAGSGAMLITSRIAMGQPRLTWTQFQDAQGRLPEALAGSDHGPVALGPQRFSAGSQIFISLRSAASPSRLALQPINAYFEPSGRATVVSAENRSVVDAVPVGFDDGRVVVVYLSSEHGAKAELMARTLRCSPNEKARH